MIGSEYLYPLQELQRQQQQIYSDACDVGIYETFEVRKQIRRSLEALKDLEGCKVERHGSTTSCKVRLAVEYSDVRGRIDGYEITVSKTELSKLTQRDPRHDGHAAFFSIEIHRTTWPVGERLGRLVPAARAA